MVLIVFGCSRGNFGCNAFLKALHLKQLQTASKLAPKPQTLKQRADE
jgi:hypothetical protein